MVSVEGYKNLTYNDFQRKLGEKLAGCQMTDMELALKVGVKSTATIKNSQRLIKQIVSDNVLTSLAQVIGLDAFVIWHNGKRYYYVSNNQI
jgi:hypothetical protein